MTLRWYLAERLAALALWVAPKGTIPGGYARGLLTASVANIAEIRRPTSTEGGE